MKRRLNNRLYYFTVEDESLLAEAFPRFEEDVYAIAYKLVGTDDVFVTTAETKEAMDRHDVPYNALASEDGSLVALHHNALSREELAEYEDALKALALAYRAIGISCVGINGESEVKVGDDPKRYTYFTAPAGHTFLWRLFYRRDEALSFLCEQLGDDDRAREWAEALPLDSAEQLASYH